MLNPSPPAESEQKQDAPPEAGGPQNDVGPYAIPKKKEEPPPPPPPAKPKKVEGMPDYSIKVDVPLVNVDVLVTTKDGQFIPGLKKDNFRVWKMASSNPSPTLRFRRRRSRLSCWSNLLPPITTSWWTR